MSRIEKRLDSMFELMERLEKREEEWREERSRWLKERLEWIEEKKAIEERINTLEWELEKNEREKRRQNIVIKGAIIEKENIKKKLEEFVEQKINVNVKVKNATEIVVKKGKSDMKMVVVELESKEMKDTKREHKNGRAKGGIITGINKKLEIKNYEELSGNIVKQEIKYGEQEWTFVGVYCQDVAKTMEIIKEKIGTQEKGGIILAGDWNAMTGREGGWVSEMEIGSKEVSNRKSKDKTINEEGRRLIKDITEEGWGIVNGQKGEEGNYTYIGSRGESVIDYVISNQEALDQIKELKIGQRTESDQMPLEIYLENEIEMVEDRGKEEKEISRREWTQELIDQYQERCKGWNWKEIQVERRWEEIKEAIEAAVPKTKKQSKVWRYRKKKSGVNNKTEIEEWRRHFMRKLGGKDEKAMMIEKVVEENARIEKSTQDQEELSKEELKRLINRLKPRKAPGDDKLENEIWKYMPKEVDAALWELMKKVWEEGRIPVQWRRGVICTIVKEIEQKLAESQFGFREGRGVMEAIYTLKHIVEDKLSKPKGKIFACFIDLKEAFDRVDRTVLKERLQDMEVSKILISRIMDIYKETSIVKVGDEKSDEFWTERGVRQGCPLSPTLFNVYLVDLEEEMRKGQVGGCRIGNEKIWSLSYADDIVLIADREEELKDMLKRFKKNTPNYLVEEECKLESMKMKALRRAIKFEEKIRDSKTKLAKEGIREKDKDKERENIGRVAKKRMEILKEEEVTETRYMRGTEFKEQNLLTKTVLPHPVGLQIILVYGCCQRVSIASFELNYTYKSLRSSGGGGVAGGGGGGDNGIADSPRGVELI
ncbi:golgin subfamily A member 6-like protein 22 [Copidosoma floridanum]|uniref:golgin subfamily A member 6-like protein 22 n=1 Tax=Copidosoma floridanum TaxID=29053 RepID=UPI0006C98B42|nr:golgin subfamily A member 6-like protein 22 [Copidosoma floridanum]